MANTLLPEDTPVDLYADSGFTVGDQIVVNNNGSCNIRLYSTAGSPVFGVDGFVLLEPGKSARNQSGDVGAWGVSVLDNICNVSEY